jgi:hypothetical protein
MQERVAPTLVVLAHSASLNFKSVMNPRIHNLRGIFADADAIAAM